MDEKLYTIGQVATILGVTKQTIRTWDREDKIRSVRIGKDGWRRFTQSEIDRIIKMDDMDV